MQYTHFPFFPKDWYDISVKLGHVQCGMSPIVNDMHYPRWSRSWSLNLVHGMSFIQTKLSSYTSPALSHLFSWSSGETARFRHIVFPNLKVWWTSGFNGTWKYVQGMGSMQLWKACEKKKDPPFVANRNQRLQAPMPPALREWYMYSQAMCWVLQANITHISCCCHLHKVWCHKGKAKTLYYISLVE